MSPRAMVVTGIVLAAIGAGLYGMYALGMHQGMAMGGSSQATPATVQADGRRVLYWHDPMVPGHKFDKPGKSPFMDMQLVPVYADDAGGDAASVRIDPALQQNLGMRTAAVEKTRIGQQLQAVGSVAYNERDVAVVQARASGFVERLLVRAPLDAVRKGQPLLEMYVPDWVAAQEDYLAVRRLGSDAPAALEEAARQRMRLAGMSDAQVDAVRRDNVVRPRLTIVSPIDGVVSELAAREGMSVANGAPLFRINGLATVWVFAQVPEGVASAVRPGTTAEVRASAFPEDAWTGKVTALLPEVDAATRTLKARIEVPNRGRKLAPGMFTRITFASPDAREALTLPSEAVIRTGTRSVVMRAAGDGRFVPVEVQAGGEADGRIEIRKGLAVGDKVAVSGQFLIDSEASLKGIAARAGDGKGGTP